MLFCVALPLYSWGQPKTLSLDEIVGRMQQAEADSRDRSIPYTATREYQLAAAGSPQPSSQVVAEINYYPPTAKDYSIVKSQGGDRGASIVRKVLDHEVQVTAHSELTAITSRNYDFALRGRDTLDGRECYLLQLTPKRQAVELIRGQAWVDVSDFLVRRMEGYDRQKPLHVDQEPDHHRQLWRSERCMAADFQPGLGRRALRRRTHFDLPRPRCSYFHLRRCEAKLAISAQRSPLQ